MPQHNLEFIKNIETSNETQLKIFQQRKKYERKHAITF